MTDGLLNLMRREAERTIGQRATTVMGIVSGYDSDHYAAKVKLQPDGQETGFLPIASPWVGAKWGLYAPPSVGDVVDVHFQEAGKGAPYVSLRFYGNNTPPLSVPSGEFWIVHKSGASFRLKNDGTAVMTDGAGATITMNGDGTATLTATEINSSATIWNHAGIFNATQFYAEGDATIPDDTYCTGLGLTQNGYITTRGGMIVAIQEAM